MPQSGEEKGDIFERWEAFENLGKDSSGLVDAVGDLYQIRSVEISYAMMLEKAGKFIEEVNIDVASLDVGPHQTADDEGIDKRDLFTVGERTVASLSEFVRAFYRYNEFFKGIGLSLSYITAFHGIRISRNYVEHVRSDIPVFYTQSEGGSWQEMWNIFVDLVSVLSELRKAGKKMSEDAMKTLEESSYNMGGYFNLSNAIADALSGALDEYKETVSTEVGALSDRSRSVIEQELNLLKEKEAAVLIDILKSILKEDDKRQLLSDENMKITESWLAS